MRDASTYRGARRNLCRAESGVWNKNYYYSNHSAKYHRASYVSKPSSKYMPHDGGKKYFKTKPTFKSASGFIGMAYHQMRHFLRNTRKKGVTYA